MLCHGKSCRGSLHYVFIMVKAVEGAYIVFMSWLKLKRELHSVYVMVKAVERA